MSDVTPQNTNDAIMAGVAQALLAAGPAIATAAAATDPRLQAALLIAQALQPSITTLVEQFNNQQMTKEQLDAKLVDLKAAAAAAHAEWLASTGIPVS